MGRSNPSSWRDQVDVVSSHGGLGWSVQAGSALGPVGVDAYATHDIDDDLGTLVSAAAESKCSEVATGPAQCTIAYWAIIVAIGEGGQPAFAKSAQQGVSCPALAFENGQGSQPGLPVGVVADLTLVQIHARAQCDGATAGNGRAAGHGERTLEAHYLGGDFVACGKLLEVRHGPGDRDGEHCDGHDQLDQGKAVVCVVQAG